MSTPPLTGPFHRVAVLNRGEAAMRFIRGAETWSRKNRTALDTIALYTEADAESPFVKAATQAVLLKTSATDRRSPYLDLDLLLHTAQAAGADAIWPGWGFLAEEPALARACQERGLIFLGPPESAIEKMSDKITAKQLADSLKIPVSPWSKEPVDNPERAFELLESIGYPALFKSAAGGGGRGIRLVQSPQDVAAAFHAATTEAQATSGNPALFIERFVPKARHIEVQILADAHGTVWTLGTRDCSVQRRNQKLFEEAPAPGLSQTTTQALEEAARKLASACNYIGVGTAEFLLLPDEKTFYFLEMNTRLQVEHTVTEAIYGVDLVAFQIDVARGVDLSTQTLPTPRGVAIEARLNAEDPDDHFAPRTGKLVRFSPPDGPWVRVDTGYTEGNSVPPDFDSNIAKIITWGTNREDAIARQHTALLDTICALETGLSNRSLLLELISDTPFRTGPVFTSWLEQYLPTRKPQQQRPHLPLAIAAAAIGDHLQLRRQEMALFFAEALSGPPRRVKSPAPRELLYLVDGRPIQVEIATLRPRHFLVRSGPFEALIRARSAGSQTMLLDLDGKRHSVIRVPHTDQVFIEVEGVAHRFQKLSGGNVTAQIPAAVNSIHVAPGQSVAPGERLITLEAMKMEFPVLASQAATVEEILVTPAQTVGAGDLLLHLRPIDDKPAQADAPITLPAHQRESLTTFEILQATLLGYDSDETLKKRAIDILLDRPQELSIPQLLTLFSLYLSRECLFWKGPGDDAKNDKNESSADQLSRFLRRRHLDEDLYSPRFTDRLAQILKLFEITEIEPGPPLDNALLRLFQSRRDRQTADQIAAASLEAALELSRSLPTDERIQLFQQALSWTKAPQDLLEALATRAATRKRWPLAALAWRYVHILSAAEVPQAKTSIQTLNGAPPKAENFDFIPLDLTDLPVTPYGPLRAFYVDSKLDKTDRRLFVEAACATHPVALERAFLDAATLIRRHQDGHNFNRITLITDGPLPADNKAWKKLARRFSYQTADLDLEALLIKSVHTNDTAVFDAAIGLGPSLRILSDTPPITPITDHQRGMNKAHRRGLFYPFELVHWLTAGTSPDADESPQKTLPTPPAGHFQEYDFDDSGRFTPTNRPWGQNQANLVTGLITNEVPEFPSGLTRVLIIGDSTRTMGSLGEAECRRIIAAIELAEERDLPVEWVPISSGARIAFDSGTENLDWTARVLRKIVEFTQAGGTIHVIVDGPCVGAQSYWNAEATMLDHCKGALIMTPRGFMILTGRKALEYSGSVSAETNVELGGQEIMLPNGEAQYRADNLLDAYELLFRHYALTDPRAKLSTEDTPDRPFTAQKAAPETGFSTLGDIFDDATNPGRKRPFPIRSIMAAVLDADTTPLERWAHIEGGESAVVWLSTLNGQPVTMIGIESQPTPRKGLTPVDGPDSWMSGTLFPHSSRKIARALSAANNTHPVIVLANLSGFDGSPESLRHRQLEFGAQIARAVVNFKGPILFNVIARYHGGAFVVFSRALNESLRASALEGTFASVIGGAPAAAVVFPRLVDQRLHQDPRFKDAQAIEDPASRRTQIMALRAEIQSALAREFDAIHDIQRARTVGSLDHIVPPQDLRAYLIHSLH